MPTFLPQSVLVNGGMMPAMMWEYLVVGASENDPGEDRPLHGDLRASAPSGNHEPSLGRPFAHTYVATRLSGTRATCTSSAPWPGRSAGTPSTALTPSSRRSSTAFPTPSAACMSPRR